MKKFDTKPTLAFINSGNVLTLKYVYDPFIGVKFDGKNFTESSTIPILMAMKMDSLFPWYPLYPWCLLFPLFPLFELSY